MQRRHFLQALSGTILGSSLLQQQVFADSNVPDALKGRILKTLKLGMVKHDGSLSEKFSIAKAAGFQAIELDAPSFAVADVKKAIQDSGLPVDGTVCTTHWNIRHTSPDAEVRAQALKDLKQALRDTRAMGGSSVLLVVGRGDDGTPEECWQRSTENISKALPVAGEEGVQILFENVWNRYGYNHDGDATQTADEYVKYVDSFNSPLIGMHFDIGNHWKYGSMGDWIRQLGKRIVKLDVKGFSRKENKFTAIGEGDIDYADVRKALREINYHGWLAAEVPGGDQAYLTGVAQQMDRAFGL